VIEVIPAIDLLDGHCVRLHQGNFSEVTHYRKSPAVLAAEYALAGAQWLHVVDLAASRDGADADTGPLFRLLRAAPQNIQTGGGVRNERDLRERYAAGAARVVVGSLCVTDHLSFTGWLGEYGSDRLVAALDVRVDADGMPWPRIHGWTEAAGVSLWELLDRLVPAGLRHLLVTDIARDGALAGPNVSLYVDIVQRYPGLELQASGGVSTLEDFGVLRRAGASAAITGKALLDGRFSLAEALQAAR
jgi:phosphoribosylformimino-5-aminoimidazole carboxamide ribotide isomerase